MEDEEEEEDMYREVTSRDLGLRREAMALSGSEGNRGGLVGFRGGPSRAVVLEFNVVDTAATIFCIRKSVRISFFEVT